MFLHIIGDKKVKYFRKQVTMNTDAHVRNCLQSDDF